MLLTIAEIARRLDIPASSVTYYRDKFRAYIPEMGEGRHRRYSEEAFEVIRFISDCMRSGMPADGVEGALQEKYGVMVDVQQGPETQQHGSAMMMREMLWDAMNDLLEQQTTVIRQQIAEEIQDKLNEAREENERLLREINKQNNERLEQRDKALMETLRSMQEAATAQTQASQSKGFFKRIFG